MHDCTIEVDDEGNKDIDDPNGNENFNDGSDFFEISSVASCSEFEKQPSAKDRELVQKSLKYLKKMIFWGRW